MKNLIGSLMTLLILVSCNTRTIENIPKSRLEFSEMPDLVQTVFDKIVEENKIIDTDTPYGIVVTNPTIKYRYEHTGIEEGIFSLLTRGCEHHLHLNNLHFKLQATSKAPIVLHENQLYYLIKSNEKSITSPTIHYMKVDLSSFLENE